MKYHYEHKWIIKSKLQFWIWLGISVIHIILLTAWIVGLSEPTQVMIIASVIQAVCGAVIARMNISYKQVRVQDEDRVVPDSVLDAAGIKQPIESKITASDLKRDLLS